MLYKWRIYDEGMRNFPSVNVIWTYLKYYAWPVCFQPAGVLTVEKCLVIIRNVDISLILFIVYTNRQRHCENVRRNKHNALYLCIKFVTIGIRIRTVYKQEVTFLTFVNRAYANTNCHEFYVQLQDIVFICPNVFTMTLPISICLLYTSPSPRDA